MIRARKAFEVVLKFQTYHGEKIGEIIEKTVYSTQSKMVMN